MPSVAGGCWKDRQKHDPWIAEGCKSIPDIVPDMQSPELRSSSNRGPGLLQDAQHNTHQASKSAGPEHEQPPPYVSQVPSFSSNKQVDCAMHSCPVRVTLAVTS